MVYSCYNYCREKTKIEALSSAVMATRSGKNLGINMTNQIRRRVHAAKVRAADKTPWVAHPNVSNYEVQCNCDQVAEMDFFRLPPI